MFDNLIQALYHLFPISYKYGVEREIIIEVSEEEYCNNNPITKYFESQKDTVQLIDNTENIDLHVKPHFRSLIIPGGFKIILKIKE